MGLGSMVGIFEKPEAPLATLALATSTGAAGLPFVLNTLGTPAPVSFLTATASVAAVISSKDISCLVIG